MILGFDSESQLIARGRLVPRTVCFSLAGYGPPPADAQPGPDVVIRSVPGPHGDMWMGVWGRGALPTAFGLMASADRLVAQNAAFDLACWIRCDTSYLGHVFDRLANGTVSDTMVREQLLRFATGEYDFVRWQGADGAQVVEKTGFSLADLTRRYLGVDLSAEKTDPNAWRVRYGELDGIPVSEWPEDAVDYAAMDSVYALLVADAQVDDGTTRPGFKVNPAEIQGYPVHDRLRVVTEDRETRNAFALHLAAIWGMKLNPDKARATLAEWDRLSSAGRAVGLARGWVRANGTVSKKAVQAAVVQGFGTVPAKYVTAPTKTFPLGQVKYGEDALTEASKAALARGDVELARDLEAYGESTEYTGHLSRYRELFSGRETNDHRYCITSRPNVLVASGRLSWADPNLTAPPRKGGYRECFEPRPGWVLCSVDYEAAEIFATAQICKKLGFGTKLLDAYNAREDLHSMMGAELRTQDGTPTTYPEFRALRKSADPEVAKEIAEYRQIGKHANFGLLSGQGPDGFAEMVRKQAGIEVRDPRGVHDAFRRMWPEVPEYHRWVKAVLGDGTVRHFVSGRVRGDCWGPSALNTYFQGLVADGAKHAFWCLTLASRVGADILDPWLVTRLDEADLTTYADAAEIYRGARPVLLPHDEGIAELPEDRAPEMGDAMALIMRLAMRAHCPDVVVRADPALSRFWSKEADTVRAPDGRLVVWEP